MKLINKYMNKHYRHCDHKVNYKYKLSSPNKHTNTNNSLSNSSPNLMNIKGQHTHFHNHILNIVDDDLKSNNLSIEDPIVNDNLRKSE